ncbi:unnamed protein product [Calypogeia fissa]
MEAGACPLEWVSHSPSASVSIINRHKQAVAADHLRCSNGYNFAPSSSFLSAPSLDSKSFSPSSPLSSSLQHGSSSLTSFVKHGAKTKMGTFNFSSTSMAMGAIFSDTSGSGNLKTIRTFPPHSHVEQKRQGYRIASLARGFEGGNRIAAAEQQDGQLSPSVLSLRRTGKARSRGRLPQLCEAIGQSGTGQPVPEEENPEPASEQASPDPLEVDWRAFRAKLVVTESVSTSDETGTSSEEKEAGHSVPLGTRWAHPILAPEAGCVLIATEKIDGQQSFERSVILLLSPGSSNPREGPYGLILNRPLSCRIKDIRPKDRTLVKFFGNCQVHHGGPLDEDMFLLLHGTPGVKGYREVIPGVYYGAANGLEEIMKGNHLLDYRFFFGYSGWGVEQLKKEIEAGLWFVAACSTDLITGHSAAGLWEEILLLMGGKYAELSKRPRRRHF